MKELIYTKYQVFSKDGKYRIGVRVYGNGRITIYTNREKRDFVFEKSSREMIKAITELLKEATKL